MTRNAAWRRPRLCLLGTLPRLHGMLRLARWLLAGMLLVPLRTIVAQDSTIVAPPPKPAVDSTRCAFCHRPNIPVALLEGLLIDARLNRSNAWILSDSTAYVNPESWRRNLRIGWDWDQDDFVVNMLGHPYMGSTYFAAARTNGMGYWAGLPFTAFNSMVWEYFGETTQPSINDFVNTSLGGVALGEMFHRVAATLRDNGASGGGRVLREVAALPFDPVGSVNRLMRGEWSRKGPNPVEHNPVGTELRLGAGAGIVRAPGGTGIDIKAAERSLIGFAELKYGDSYIDSMRKPFDAFSMRIQFAPGHGGLTQLTGVGRITGKNIGSEDFPRQLEINQRFEYVNNAALQFGAQTIEFGMSTRKHISDRFWIRTLIAADALVLAGINAPGAGVGPRTYDFGPGVGATVSVNVERNTDPYLTVRYQPAYTRTINGANGADHFTSFALAEADIPVLRQLVLVIQGNYFTRVSRYANGSRNSNSVPELRVSVAYKTRR